MFYRVKMYIIEMLFKVLCISYLVFPISALPQVLGVTTDSLLNENGLENRVTNVKNVELLRKIEQVDQMDEEDKKVIERVIDFALLKYSVKKLQAA